jgi:hypothetical protein
MDPFLFLAERVKRLCTQLYLLDKKYHTEHKMSFSLGWFLEKRGRLFFQVLKHKYEENDYEEF